MNAFIFLCFVEVTTKCIVQCEHEAERKYNEVIGYKWEKHLEHLMIIKGEEKAQPREEVIQIKTTRE